MQINVELVRKLAKLDPGVREIFYSFVEEFYKEQDKVLSKDDIKELNSKIESLGELNKLNSLKQEIASLKKIYSSLEEKIDLKLSENEKKINDISSQLSSIKEDLTKNINDVLNLKEELITVVKSNKGFDPKNIIDLIEKHTQTLKESVENFKDKIDEISKNISITSKNKILSKLSKALKKKLSLNVKEHFKAKTFDLKNKKFTFPIFGSGTKNKKSHTIVGNIISSPTKKDIEDFVDIVEILQKEKQIPQMVCKVLVVEEIEQDLEKMAEKKGISIIWMQDM